MLIVVSAITVAQRGDGNGIGVILFLFIVLLLGARLTGELQSDLRIYRQETDHKV